MALRVEGYSATKLKTELSKQVPATEDSISREIPYRFNIEITGNDGKSITLIFETEMLTENKILSLMAVIIELKSIIEQEDIEKNMTIVPKLSSLLSLLCKCKNPEVIVNYSISKINETQFKEIIFDNDYYELFLNLLDIGIEPFNKLKTLSKRKLKNVFKKKFLKVLKSYSLEYLKNLTDIFIKNKVMVLFNLMDLSLILSIANSVTEYNTYRVKKNHQIIEKIISTLMGQQENLTCMYKTNWGTIKTGENQSLELKYNETSQSNNGNNTKNGS